MAALATIEQGLPPKLIRFFARFPPRLYGVHFTGEKILTIQDKIAIEGNRKTGEPPTISKPSKASSSSTQSQPTSSDTTSQISQPVKIRPREAFVRSNITDPETNEPIFLPTDQPPNPFLPYKNPATGQWRSPKYSLRQQGDLFKLARVFGVESLMPASRKSTSFKEDRMLKRGLAVKGTGEGQKVKGHKWERNMGDVLEKRITAMENMPELIREWRMRGNGRNWRKYPSKAGSS